MAKEVKQPTGTKPRPPVVAVLGHVDHGKTTLLDYIRKSNVAGKEAGGITQSVGAYEIEHPSTHSTDSGQASSGQAKKITFIDTPGHEAFSAMRSRGASIADLAILVVSAEEGLKPQTHESIKILTESKTPFVVAITKTDKSGANVEKVKNELTSAGVLLEGYGGSVSYQAISAKTGEGVSDLLDHLLLASDVENFTYDPALPGEGFVLETSMNRQRGNEATLIIKNGTLKFGDEIATGTAHGKVKILENFLGQAMKTLEPSAPAVVIGFEKLPQVGEVFTAGSSVTSAMKDRANAPIARQGAPLTHITDSERENTTHIILKAADTGSLEALVQIVSALKLEKPIKIVAQSVGDVVDNEVKLAISTNSIIATFGTRIDKAAKSLAEINRVTILSSDVIYHLVKAIEEFVISAKVMAAGALEVLAVFNQAKLEKQVVGGRVVEGIFKNRAAIEIERAGAIVGRGRVTNLQQQKKDAAQVTEGNECGVKVNADVAILVGDKLVIRV